MNDKAMMKAQPNNLAVIQGGLQKLLPALKTAIPATMRKYLTPESMTKVAFLAIRKNPDLARCTPESIYQSIMDAGTLGLEVGGLLGHAHLVPFRNNKKGTMEAQLIVGYSGYINLARRSGEINSVVAQVVYRNDIFDIDLASGKPPVHKPNLEGDRGEPYLVYCVAFFKDGGFHPEMMTKDDVDKIRKKSKMPDGPAWRDNYWAMALKSCIRKAKKLWPLSTNAAIELAKADAAEDREVGGDWNISLSDTPDMPQIEESKPSRVDEVFAKIQGDNPATGETPWAGGPEDHQAPVYTAENIAMADEELLALVRIRWGQLMPEYSTDKDILQALAGLGVKHTALSQFSVADCQKILDHVDRPRPQAQA
jgi:recombination protein RecT